MEVLFRAGGRSVVAFRATRTMFTVSGLHRPDRKAMTENAVQLNFV
jgi:hypothetical protein